VNVRSGNFAYFDNAVQTIRAEHIMAWRAAAGLSRWRWMASSTGMAAWYRTRRSIGCFPRIPGWIRWCFRWTCGARGPLPSDMTSVAVRMKEIQFSSRTRAATDTFRQQQQWRGGLPAAGRNHPARIAGYA
jgi:NTE family protein